MDLINAARMMEIHILKKKTKLHFQQQVDNVFSQLLDWSPFRHCTAYWLYTAF